MVSVTMMGFICSCDNTKDNDEYTKYNGTTPSVYFKIQSAMDVALGENDTEFSFPIYRDSKEGEETAQLEWKGAEDFNAPTQVTFADGSDVAAVTVTFDINEIQANHQYDIACAIKGTEDSGFTQSTMDLVVQYTSWQDLGQATYIDYFVGPYAAGYSPDPYPVNIQEHPVKAGFFRIADPYGEAYPFNEPGDWDDSVITYLYVNAMDPDHVFISDKDGNPAWYETTCDWGWGPFEITTYASYYLMNGQTPPDELWGTYHDGVIYLGTDSALCYTPTYDVEPETVEGPAEWIILPTAAE